jgi:hypothetical protein
MSSKYAKNVLWSNKSTGEVLKKGYAALHQDKDNQHFIDFVIRNVLTEKQRNELGISF